MNIALWLERLGKADPGRPAIGHGRRVAATYGEVAERAARIAGALRGWLGLAPGDRVGIVARNSPEYVEILHGIWLAGCAAVPANAKLHGAELGYILDHSGARVCFASPALDEAIAAHAPATLERMIAIGSRDYAALLSAEPMAAAPCRADDLAWLFYTSGTTGRPKGAMLSHGNLAAASFAYLAEVDPVAPGDVILHAAPMSHGSGLYMMANVLRRAVNVVPESGGFEPEEVFALAAHWRRTSMFAAPTMVKRLVASPVDCDPAAFRTIVYGGAPMYVEDARAALDRLGPCLAQIYGQGESPMTITTLSKAEIADRGHPRWQERVASAGLAFACLEVAVVDAEDRPVPHGEAGEIVCRGAPVMAGYWNDADATARALRGGWLHTGDIGTLDADGYLTLKDRSKDLIISGGSNIYPREVEEVLLAHPGVREVSVIGRADPDWGEIVVAYVVGAAPAGELDALCLERIARFKRPKDYVFVDALPKNNYGKILKTELRVWDARRMKDDRHG
ncbi:AMP-binding protein [Chelatococcus sp. SYSU_G07232]|uniref:AMP-binding protein n=1 Tax=Chelatococcus albus TaxID=3047466 RepID=A0ABT7AKI1_9HYPH|nr:AMP-binding protein [Chelatococcus sp. SYSU_G07232]MDJ1159872.1 AMP-binding protein [Chelatococcus sp. SYSU_G07232]